MPSTVTGLVLFVLFFAPGFAFLMRMESRLAPKERSALREAGVVVTTSLLFDGLALLLFAIIRVALPWFGPDVDAFVRSPSEYFVDHYAEVLTWGTFLLLVAMGLAWLWSVPPVWVDSALGRGERFFASRGTRIAGALGGHLQTARHQLSRRRRRPIVAESAWSKIMHAKRGHYVVVSARLVDGAWVQGRLWSVNPSLQETGDRSLILEPPLRLKEDSKKIQDRTEGLMVIQADQIKTLEASYFPDP